jgi:hypothetical protein
VGGSPLPPSRPEPSKSLRRHLVPPGRVPPCPAASVGASVMSRLQPTGAAPPHPPRRPWRWEVDRGGARARPFNGGGGYGPGAVVGPSHQPDGPGRRRRRLARGTCTANAEWVLEPRAVPGCSRSTPGRPCAQQTLAYCGARPGIPVCRSTAEGVLPCRSRVPCVGPGGAPPRLPCPRGVPMRVVPPPKVGWEVLRCRCRWIPPPGLMRNPSCGRRWSPALAR